MSRSPLEGFNEAGAPSTGDAVWRPLTVDSAAANTGGSCLAPPTRATTAASRSLEPNDTPRIAPNVGVSRSLRREHPSHILLEQPTCGLQGGRDNSREPKRS